MKQRAELRRRACTGCGSEGAGSGETLPSRVHRLFPPPNQGEVYFSKPQEIITYAASGLVNEDLQFSG